MKMRKYEIQNFLISIRTFLYLGNDLRVRIDRIIFFPVIISTGDVTWGHVRSVVTP